MDFGIFNLMGYRTPGTAAAALYDGAIAQVKAAEAAGFDIAWFARRIRDALAQEGRLLMANSMNHEGGDQMLMPFVKLNYSELFKKVGFNLIKERKFVEQIAKSSEAVSSDIY